MSLSGLKDPARSDLKISLRSGKIIPVRSVRIFKITTDTTSTNVTPFLKHIRDTVDTDASVDTNQFEWKTLWMNDLIHNTLKFVNKIRWRKIRMLANLDKDCTTKQLITSLRNFYPILNEYCLFEFNDDEDFEVMVTITSIIQNNNATTKTSSPASNKTIIDNDKRTTPLTVTTIVDKTSVKHNNDVSVNTDLPSTPDIVQEFEHFNANSDNDTTPTVDRVIESLILTIIDDDDDDNYPTEPEFQDFDALPVQKATKASWFTVPTRGRTSTLSTTTHSTSRFSVKKNIYDNLREEDTNEKSTILNNSSNDDVLVQDDRITSSIVRASNKINFDVAKIVANPSPLLSNDTINDFLSPQEARHDDTPLRSNTVVNAKNIPVIHLDEIESDNESSVGMPRLLTRHDDNSSTDSDELHYFQDDKTNIAEWLEADDDDSVSKAHHSVSFKTDDQKIVDKSNNVQDTLIEPIVVLFGNDCWRKNCAVRFHCVIHFSSNEMTGVVAT